MPKAQRKAATALTSLPLERLSVGDERSFRHVALYADLRELLRRARYRFQVLPARHARRADRALLLNLTFWSPDAGGDVLVGPHLPADVVAHVAWHHLAARAVPTRRGKPSAPALLLGESIASAFDVYLVGRLLGLAPRSTFLATQTPAMADAAAAAGLSAAGFARLLQRMAYDPEAAFGQLRALLYDAALALLACRDAAEGFVALERFEAHPFAPLLPRYELSNWVLYARAYAGATADARVQRIDAALRAGSPAGAGALAWLERHWLAPALRAPRSA